jgi:hypothetical protein
MATFDTVRALASALPGVEESTSYGTPALKVAGKLFARLLEDGERVAVYSHERDALLAGDPLAFSVPEHYRNHPMVVVTLVAVDADELREVLTDSWRIRAPKRLLG